jgi:hypothetical protein
MTPSINMTIDVVSGVDSGGDKNSLNTTLPIPHAVLPSWAGAGLKVI